VRESLDPTQEQASASSCGSRLDLNELDRAYVRHRGLAIRLVA
jgi:hypothetical protein